MSVADIPGIIENAHLNRGLGFSFLRHVERCRCLLYVVDLSCADPGHQLNVLRSELELYEPGLSRRPHLVVGNKVDLVEADGGGEAALRDVVGDSAQVLTISSKCHTRVDRLSDIIRQMYDAYTDKTVDQCT